MAMFRNVMVYLGLGPDDEYDENYLYDEDNVDFDGLERRTVTHRANDGVRIVEEDDDFGVGTVRPMIRPVPDGGSVVSERPLGDSRPVVAGGAFASDLRTGSVEHPSAGIGESASKAVAPGAENRPSESGIFGVKNGGGANGGGQSLGGPTIGGQSVGGQSVGGQSIGGQSIGGQQRSEPNRAGSPNQGSVTDSARQAASRLGASDTNQPGGSPSRPHNERTGVPMDDFSQSQGARGIKPRSVTPRSFDDAKSVANEYRAGSPVVMNLRETDKETGRRLLDFSSGMVYGLGGGMEKLAANVFLITPDGVEVSADDRRRLEERGYGR